MKCANKSQKECPAFGTKCNYCDKDHHFEKMCRGKHGAKPAKSTGHEDAISDTLCQVTSTESTKKASLAHHIFDKFTKEWLRRRSKSQPYVRLQMNIQQEDYDHFGFPSGYHKHVPSSVLWLTQAARAA